MNGLLHFLRLGFFSAFLLFLGNGRAATADFPNRFDQANQFYEQGHYRQAAAAYQALLTNAPASPTLQFNLGNSWFKAGELGRAIAAYRLALRGAPRDPAIRFNLAFARKQLVGLPPPQSPAWAKAVRMLTLDEWTFLAALLYWIVMLLLIIRELHPPFQRGLRPYTIVAAVLILLPLSGLLLHFYLAQEKEAVVIASNVPVRFGPLSESQAHFQLRNGAEVQVLDHKTLQNQTWLRVQDTTGRTGWVADSDLLKLP